MTEEEAMRGVNDTTDLKLRKSARAAIGDVGLTEDEVRIQVRKEEVEDLKGPLHVLVVVPGSAVDDGAWSAKELATVDPKVQLKIWRSVVRVSSEDVCSGTAVVVDLTSTHLYLLTNLQPWVDDTFTYHLSFDFTKEIKRYRRRHPRMKRSGRKRNANNVQDADVAKQTRRKSTRTAAMKSSVKSDKPQVVVEQLLPDRQKSTAPGLSGSAIVCTKSGVVVGYLGGGLDGSAKNEQYQIYGYTFHGVLLELPSSLPQVEIKDEL
ncbi:CRN-like protein [Plasmopara halstedii]|uniref:CRN-like protein n=1 Tax=Plasmopara halstedii TaxID=4781 RepID=A0A0P1B653_PLAHL|nr:CRN-like protein [Plasmopara halstedii]CEG49697.1 CRN-like protein [Plasmopara halstedii]|eukprot:XP_024586066.1 CRN-like protein [Plasmopara halstedii]